MTEYRIQRNKTLREYRVVSRDDNSLYGWIALKSTYYTLEDAKDAIKTLEQHEARINPDNWSFIDGT